jgi:hypothetical protein
VSETTAGRSGPWRYLRWALVGGLVIMIVVGIYSATSMFWAVQGVRSDVDTAASAVEGGDFSGASTAVTELASAGRPHTRAPA